MPRMGAPGPLKLGAQLITRHAQEVNGDLLPGDESGSLSSNHDPEQGGRMLRSLAHQLHHTLH